MYLLPLAAFLQDAGGVINGPVMFADRQVGALMQVHLNHQVVVLQLQLLKCPKGQKGRVSAQLHQTIQLRFTKYKNCYQSRCKSEHTGN